MKQVWFTGAACGGLLLQAWGSSAAVPPGQPGYYAVLHYVVSAKASGAGQCTDKPLHYFTSSYYYPGPGKPGATDWRPINTASYLGEFIAKFPVTPTAGVGHSSGSYTSTIEPAETVVSAAFTSDNTAFDAHSSTGVVTYVYPAEGGGTCTQAEHLNYTPMGK